MTRSWVLWVAVYSAVLSTGLLVWEIVRRR